ncbi:glycosyl transferase [Halogeometricum borinquense DSM 11551]|uniref:Glycosyl transferase n=1 Tax=Halogeometricum borinquense (strain ATCC 700274 / DSM 11551 / JCM 10706 / KCTC 4070 / PR3) TaxID=469382 RepID=E4NWB0_HALBP|nr:glycosyltransferase family 2 protein [Halogeometricum borinquense]ADQ69330.1 glycosyl transferase [Halogeometricum borinquense DSM 11551]ELY26221.1 glycosyl transferase [Halogeometricum borinquense DSM 11551]
MYKGNRVAVVVPAYNEERFVGRTIESVPSYVDRVYAVDDGSTDDTWQEIRETARRLNDDRAEPVAPDGGHHEGPHVVPIRHETNSGVGAGIKTGYYRAMADEMDVVAVMNGDAQMDPAVLPHFLDPIVEGRADYAKGDRISRRENVGEMSSWRLFGNKLLTRLTNLSSGYWKTIDSQNGYTAISVEVLERIPLVEVYDQYGFLNDMLTTLNLHDARVVNVPHQAVYGDEESGIVYRTFVPSLSGLLFQNFLRRLGHRASDRSYQPAVAAYVLGMVGMFVGGLHAIRSVSRVLRRRNDAATSKSLFGLVVSVLVFLAGTILDRRANEHLEKGFETDVPAYDGGDDGDE